MLYLAPFISNAIQDSRFSSRGASAHVQGPISHLDTTVTLDAHQTAYQGYKSNIDAFLAATALGKKVRVTEEYFDFDFGSYIPSLPLALPNTVVSFNVSSGALSKIRSFMEAGCAQVTKIEGISKHKQAFVLVSPTLACLQKISRGTIEPPRYGGASPISSVLALSKVYVMIDLYLRTNTYPAFKGGDEEDEATFGRSSYLKRLAVSEIPEYLVDKRPRYGSVNMTHKVGEENAVKEEGQWYGKISDKDLEIEMEVSDAVHVAKPSPASDSSLSFGLPSACPRHSGIVFPYFDGMNHGDVGFLRYMATKFIRLLGSDYRNEFLTLRSDISGVSGSKQAIITCHILKGIEISLDAQGQLYLMFDGETYLGFVVLGSMWRIRTGNKWNIPSSPDSLAEELSTVKTHRSSLDEVLGILKGLGQMVEKEDISTGSGLAFQLGLLEWTDSEDELAGIRKTLEDAVQRLDFGKRKTAISPEKFADALAMIADKSMSLTDLYIQFPKSSEYHFFRERAAIVLSQFGSRIPSFNISRGEGCTVIGNDKILSDGEMDVGKLEVLSEKIEKIAVVEKPFSSGVKDFQSFLVDRKIYSSSNERASTYRVNHYSKIQKDKLLGGIARVIAGNPDIQKIDDASGSKKKKDVKMTEDAFLASLDL